MATFAVQEVLLFRDQPDAVFQIVLAYNHDLIKITRSLTEIRSFFQDVIQSQRFGPLSLLTLNCPADTVPSTALVERDLCDVLLAVSDNVWFHLDIVNFFDGVPATAQLSKLHMINLTRQMQALAMQNANLERRLAQIEESLWISSQSATTRSAETPPGSLSHNTQESETLCGGAVSAAPAAPAAPLTAVSVARSECESDGESDSDDDASLSLTERSLSLSHTQTPRERESGTERERDREREELVASLSHCEALRHTHTHDDVDRAVLPLLLPTERAVHTHNAMVHALKEQARLAVNCSLFACGAQQSGLSLPDDPLQVSLLLSKNHFPTWHTALAERLSAVAADALSLSLSVGIGSERERDREKESLTVSDVRYSSDESESGGFYVMCSLSLSPSPSLSHRERDSERERETQSVEIRANRRTEIVWQSFLSEFNALVGRESLFQRSLLLVRAWWRCEASAFSLSSQSEREKEKDRESGEQGDEKERDRERERDVSSYLSPHTLAVLVVMLFNTHHTAIHSPLDALSLLLRELLSLPLSPSHTAQGTAWTIHGPCALSLSHNAGTQLATHSSPRGASLSLPQSALSQELLSRDALHKYWALFYPTRAAALSPYYSADNGANPANGANGTNGTVVWLEQRSALTVLHPLSVTHTQRLSARRAAVVQRVFSRAARRLCESLALSLPLSQTFFAGIIKQYSEYPLSSHVTRGAGPFALAHSSLSLRESAQSLLRHVLHCNFVLEGIVCESALLTATVESLSVKGPSPVGEVGKMLTETACLPSLSLTLKDAFGGLKKFLERYPSLFVFAADHPFNPHVLLRAALLPEHAQCVQRGVLPAHIVAMYKKSPHKKPNMQRALGALVGETSFSAESESPQSRYRTSSTSLSAAPPHTTLSHMSASQYQNAPVGPNNGNLPYYNGGRNVISSRFAPSLSHNAHGAQLPHSAPTQSVSHNFYGESNSFASQPYNAYNGDNNALFSSLRDSRERERENDSLWLGLGLSENGGNSNNKVYNAGNSAQFGTLPSQSRFDFSGLNGLGGGGGAGNSATHRFNSFGGNRF